MDLEARVANVEESFVKLLARVCKLTNDHTILVEALAQIANVPVGRWAERTAEERVQEMRSIALEAIKEVTR